MEVLLRFLDFIKLVSISTGTLLISLCGGLFLFGIMLYIMARLTRNTFSKSIGTKFDHYFTGLIGTPVHEFGHALFCIPFGHKIIALKLFVFQPKDNTLGYVNHSYNSHNIWHQIGNFFIGIGPILFGSIIIFVLVKYLLANGSGIVALLFENTMANNLDLSLKTMFLNAIKIIQHIFTSSNLKTWQFWVFIYTTLSIASHMELSPPDLKGALSGLITLVIVLFIINGLMLTFGSPITIGTSVMKYISMFNGILFFALTLSSLFFIVSFFVLNIYTLLFKRTAFHPFN
jgi:hypothetical protein